ncbi:hypothetical protein CASFOL_003625 [Castilleja foliolosa]|uniref:Uncharacterized protein n=1 Tax=Castilleja foliolosa TaxID=1961234 RepID=A0ABD3ELL4_9LAMI
MPWPNREWASLWDDHMILSPCGQELLLVRKMYVCQFSPDKFDFRVFRVDVDRKAKRIHLSRPLTILLRSVQNISGERC